MTSTATNDAILRAACAQAGLHSSTASVLRQHAASVWLLRDVDIVVRIGRSAERAERAVRITHWLHEQGFPAVQPIDIDQPITIDNAAVTFWKHYPQHGRPAPGAAALGGLLRRLHHVPQPPVTLETYVPLSALGAVLESDTQLSEGDRSWLIDRRMRLLRTYQQLQSELGEGFIHGDAYPGNALWDGDTVRLGDWDEVARGPRELDLVSTHQGERFGRSAAKRQAFTDAYGWDVTVWAGYSTLRDIRELHTLGAYLARAGRGDATAFAELRYRVATLRAGDRHSLWHAT